MVFLPKLIQKTLWMIKEAESVEELVSTEHLVVSEDIVVNFPRHSTLLGIR